MKKVEKRVRKAQLEAYKRLNLVAEHSPYENIYYCCTQKTASQWFKAIFTDPVFYRHTGLSVVPYMVGTDPSYATQLESPFPPRTIATHLYINYPTFERIPKPECYRTFFVLRDPRDIVISWYFSTKYSHHPYPKVVERRRKLESMDFHNGLKFSIDELAKEGLFATQRTWVEAAMYRPAIKIFRYEDFAHDNRSFLAGLFDYLEVHMPDRHFSKLYARHRFNKYAGNRDQGEDDNKSHYRKGVAGDWRNHFDASIETYFSHEVGNLLSLLGYSD